MNFWEGNTVFVTRYNLEVWEGEIKGDTFVAKQGKTFPYKEIAVIWKNDPREKHEGHNDLS